MKNKVVVQDSSDESDSPLPELSKNAKGKKAQPKPAAKPAKKVQKEESDEDTPVQPKAKAQKAVRKGSKASVDEQRSVSIKAAKNGKATKAPVAKKADSSSEEEDSVPVKKNNKSSPKVIAKPSPKVQAKKAPKKMESSEESSSEEAPKKPVAKKVVQKPAVESSSEEESVPIVAPSKKDVKKAKEVAKKPVKKAESSEESESEQKPKPVARKVSKEVKKVVKKPVSSDEQSEEEVVVKKPAKKVKVAKKESSDEEEEVQKPKSRKASVVSNGHAANDEEGEFQIRVAGLSFNAYDEDVRSYFEENCGNVVNVHLLMRPDGKPKGIGFVKFSMKSSFNKAIELNGSEHMGRSLNIEESHGKNNNQAPGGFGNKPNNRGPPQAQGDAVIESSTLFIGGLSYNSTVESLNQFFSAAGNVQSSRIVTDKETGNPRGFGYVEFYDVETAKKAYAELNGQSLDGRYIRLDAATQRDRTNAPSGGRGGFGGGDRGGDRGGFGGGRGGFGGGRGGFGGGDRGGFGGARANSSVVLSQDDKNAKKGSIGGFAGKKMTL